MPQIKSILRVNEILHENERLMSQNGKFYAIMQDDNNFVVYSASPVNALWATNTCQPGISHLILQADGNLVLYNPTNRG